MSAHLRKQLAEEAAKIMVQEFVEDFKLAKQKALHRLGLSEHTPLPSNAEIHEALAIYQDLFAPNDQALQLQKQREAALNAMQMCQEFSPYLVGTVLDGSAQYHHEIQLHLFNDEPESVAICLIDRNIPYKLSQHSYRYPYKGKYKDKTLKDKKSHSQHLEVPCYRFIAGEDKIALAVFPLSERHQIPLDPVSGKSMQRANIQALKTLLQHA